MKEYLTKPYVEYDFSSLAILKIFEADSAIVRDVMPQTIWPLHTYPVSEALDCINWLNARKPRAQRTVINVIMTVFSLGLSVVLALPVTFSASLGQIEDLALLGAPTTSSRVGIPPGRCSSTACRCGGSACSVASAISFLLALSCHSCSGRDSVL